MKTNTELYAEAKETLPESNKPETLLGPAIHHSVAALVATPNQAEEAIDALKRVGFTAGEISFLYSDSEGIHTLFHVNSTKAPEGATVGAGSGGVLGGIAGLLLGLGALTIPGIGPFVAAGPIMTALSGAAVGGALGGLGGYLVGLGIPEYEAKLYVGKLTEGNMLIVVHCEADMAKLRTARASLASVKATDISTTIPIPLPE